MFPIEMIKAKNNSKLLEFIKLVSFLLVLGGAYFGILCLAEGGWPDPPTRTSRLNLAATSAQIGATLLALLSAGLGFVLTRPGLRQTERAINLIARAPTTLLLGLSLVASVALGILACTFAPEAPPEKALSWDISAILSVLSSFFTVAGVLGTAYWTASAPRLLSLEAILLGFANAVPSNWIESANAYAKSIPPEKLHHSIDVDDVRSFGLPLGDSVSLFLDALCGWINTPQNSQAAKILEKHLHTLRPKLLSPNYILASNILPVHFQELIDHAVQSNDPRIIWTVITWIDDLHVSWENSSSENNRLYITRANHYNWLLPSVCRWILDREMDYPATQILRGLSTFAQNTKRACDDSPMSIALPHLLWLLSQFVTIKYPRGASAVWFEIDMYIRRTRSKVQDYSLDSIFQIANRAGELKLPAFGGDKNFGLLRDWMVIGICRAVDEIVEKPTGADVLWASQVLQRVRTLYSGDQIPRWGGREIKDIDEAERKVQILQKNAPPS